MADTTTSKVDADSASIRLTHMTGLAEALHNHPHQNGCILGQESMQFHRQWHVDDRQVTHEVASTPLHVMHSGLLIIFRLEQ